MAATSQSRVENQRLSVASSESRKDNSATAAAPTFSRAQANRGRPTRPRLTVFRSHKHIYAQVIDDGQGRTLAAASTADKDLAAT